LDKAKAAKLSLDSSNTNIGDAKEQYEAKKSEAQNYSTNELAKDKYESIKNELDSELTRIQNLVDSASEEQKTPEFYLDKKQKVQDALDKAKAAKNELDNSSSSEGLQYWRNKYIELKTEINNYKNSNYYSTLQPERREYDRLSQIDDKDYEKYEEDDESVKTEDYFKKRYEYISKEFELSKKHIENINEVKEVFENKKQEVSEYILNQLNDENYSEIKKELNNSLLNVEKILKTIKDNNVEYKKDYLFFESLIDYLNYELNKAKEEKESFNDFANWFNSYKTTVEDFASSSLGENKYKQIKNKLENKILEITNEIESIPESQRNFDVYKAAKQKLEKELKESKFSKLLEDDYYEAYNKMRIEAEKFNNISLANFNFSTNITLNKLSSSAESIYDWFLRNNSEVDKDMSRNFSLEEKTQEFYKNNINKIKEYMKYADNVKEEILKFNDFSNQKEYLDFKKALNVAKTLVRTKYSIFGLNHSKWQEAIQFEKDYLSGISRAFYYRNIDQFKENYNEYKNNFLPKLKKYREEWLDKVDYAILNPGTESGYKYNLQNTLDKYKSKLNEHFGINEIPNEMIERNNKWASELIKIFSDEENLISNLAKYETLLTYSYNQYYDTFMTKYENKNIKLTDDEIVELIKSFIDEKNSFSQKLEEIKTFKESLNDDKYNDLKEQINTFIEETNNSYNENKNDYINLKYYLEYKQNLADSTIDYVAHLKEVNQNLINKLSEFEASKSQLDQSN
uniref:hypothetical protein n=1 Tax=Mycoplasmopsis arginini TaxID=2094 RepID=UPI003CFF51DE